MVWEALIQVGRHDLIGSHCGCWIAANPPNEAIKSRRRAVNSGGNGHYHTVAGQETQTQG
jgi:hypothetical protein